VNFSKKRRAPFLAEVEELLLVEVGVALNLCNTSGYFIND
jgi:hypothetical protein